jgi:asparagine synthase (glutamine-hydrolysing)
MARCLVHRGPDAEGFFLEGDAGFAFRRLSIIDLETGDQPLFNEDRSLVLLCNGEIFNHLDLRDRLTELGHRLVTRCDVEVLVHLYEEYGVDTPSHLNGQFAFVIWDRLRQTLFLARDHFGILPLYYTLVDGLFVFGSEIKAILEHPLVERSVDLQGLDQVFSLPGLVSPTTMFKGIHQLRHGHSLLVAEGRIAERQYWDLDYPREGEIEYREEGFYREGLTDLFARSVQDRLQADVPVGLYLSGGLDSSLIAAMVRRLDGSSGRKAFAVSFSDPEADESRYQQVMAKHAGCTLREVSFDVEKASELIETMVYHAECPVKETYNTCSLALSRSVRDSGMKVVLSGEGADELFAGYVGYRFDQMRGSRQSLAAVEPLEIQFRESLWGDRDFGYEQSCVDLRRTKLGLYAEPLRQSFDSFDCFRQPFVDKERLHGRHRVHQRSYLDFKLRMADHLLADHGDRMALANSVEARYPFLDVALVDFVRQVPPGLKLNGYTEKYILRRMGEEMLPPEILRREKFGWYAPGSPELLQRRAGWIWEALSFDRIRRQGYFDPCAIEALKKRYAENRFKLNQPFETDLLIIVATFGLFLDLFRMPDLG